MAATIFFRPGGGQGTDNKDIQDFNMMKFFWDGFGITPDKLEQYDNHWVQKMLIIGKAECKGMREEMNKK